MTTPSREEILANFQACTDIQDVSQCIYHLEEANWNLQDAINSVLSEVNELHFNRTEQPDIEIIETFLPVQNPVRKQEDQTECMDLLSAVCTSSEKTKFLEKNEKQCSSSSLDSDEHYLNFNIWHEDKMHHIQIIDNRSVGTLKQLLQLECGIPPCNQNLQGWSDLNLQIPNDDTLLSSLNLPLVVTLCLQVTDFSVEETDSHWIDRLNSTFSVNIFNMDDKKSYCLNCPGTKTVHDVKEDVHNLTGVPVSKQIWIGWPEHVDDDSVPMPSGRVLNDLNFYYILQTTLAGLNVALKIDLSFKKDDHIKPFVNKKQMIIDLNSDSEEEFEDASDHLVDDEIFINESGTKKLQLLVPENVDDETEACIHFSEEFSNRYGPLHPPFFQGPLKEAIQELTLKSAKERKLLAVYLHDDASVLVNVFCSQLLCSESVVSFITSNFSIWGWDMTLQTNKDKILVSLSSLFGPMVANSISMLRQDLFPVIIIIMRSRSNTEVLSLIDGSVALDELMTTLIHAVDVWAENQQQEILEDEQREERETVKREQDHAYHMSLQADRAKEEARKALIEEQMKLQEEQELEKQKMEEEMLHQEEIKEAVRRSLEMQIPDEPDESENSRIIHLRFRIPNGPSFSRRFCSHNTLQLTLLNPMSSLHDLKLFPQETLTIEQR